MIRSLKARLKRTSIKLAGLAKQQALSQLKKAFPDKTEQELTELQQACYKADPIAVKTNNGKTPYVSQVLKWVSEESLVLPEDLQTIFEGLKKFHSAKYQQGVLNKSISEFNTPGDLYRELEDVKPEESSETRRFDAPIVYEDENIRVYQIDKWIDRPEEPGTHLWLKGTHWCVRHKEAFNSYGGVFYLICDKSDKRLALSDPKTSSLKDVYDRSLIRSSPEVAELCRDFISEFVLISDDTSSLINWTPDFIKRAVEQDGENLKHVPRKHRTPELCKIAVEQNGRALESVPHEHRTPELCKIAVEQNGRALWGVPPEHRTPELCKIAVEQNGLVLESVPEKHRTPELCKIAIKQHPEALWHVPRELRTPELCKIAVEKDGRAFQFVPPEHLTPELCKIAVEQNGGALRFVPDKHRTPELCKTAVEQNGTALWAVPRKYRTPELCKIAVERSGWALQFVPPEHLTPELCKIAVEKDGGALRHVPPELREQVERELIEERQNNRTGQALKQRLEKTSIRLAGLAKQQALSQLKKAFPDKTEQELTELQQACYKADPIAVKTNNGKTPYVSQILKWVSEGSLVLPEDLQTIFEGLKKFHSAKYQQGVLNKSISEFNTPGDLYQELSHLEIPKGETPQTRRFDAPIIYEDENIRVYQIDKWIDHPEEPGTHLWLKGTHWCVRHKETFNSYGGVFYLICDKSDKRLALSDPKSGDLKDVYDHSLIRSSPEVAELCRGFVSEFMLISDDTSSLINWTPKTYPIALKQEILSLDKIPFNDHTPELHKIAIEQDPWALGDILLEDRTPELCKMAVKQEAWTLNLVPPTLRTSELYIMAIEQKVLKLGEIPEEHRTPEVCRTAVEWDETALGDVPYEHRTPELYKRAVERFGWALEYVPPEHRTLELCKRAVERNGGALEYVPEELRTLEMCEIAVEEVTWAIRHVPPEIREQMKREVAEERQSSRTGQALKQRLEKTSIRLAGLAKQQALSQLKKAFPNKTEQELAELQQACYKADPIAVKTNNGKTPYVSQILKWVSEGSLVLPEDLQTIFEGLKKFHSAKYQQGTLNKSISEFNTPGDLYRELDQIKPEEVSGETRRFDAPIIYEDENIRVYQIDKWIDHPEELGTHLWLKGTHWCVRHKETFNSYGGVFYLICDKSDKRLALSDPKTRGLKDVHDRSLVVSSPEVAELCRGFISEFILISDETSSLIDWTPDLVKRAVEQDGENLKYVPHEHRTPELCKTAVEQDGGALWYVPRKYRTPELCKIAVEKEGYALYYVPDEHRTPELCKIAVERNGMALRHVPPEHCTLELCKIAVERRGGALRYVPREHRTPELCKTAVEQNGMALHYVPPEHLTSELSKIAVEQNGMALHYVPSEHLTPELYKRAVEKDGKALQLVSKEYRTPELCKTAVEKEVKALEYVPEEHRTPELCKMAVERNGMALRHVPKEHCTLELCKIAVEQNGGALWYVPYKLREQVRREVAEERQSNRTGQLIRKLKSMNKRRIAQPVTTPVREPKTAPIIPEKTPKRDPWKPPRPVVTPKPKAKEEELSIAATLKLKKSISSLKNILAQNSILNVEDTREYSTDEPVFPIRIVYTGEPSTISNQMRILRQADLDFNVTDEEESNTVEEFVSELHNLYNAEGRKFRSLDQARAYAEEFCEKYSEFDLRDFYIADAADERFPVDQVSPRQTILPGTRDPQQWVIPGMGVDLPPPEKP